MSTALDIKKLPQNPSNLMLPFYISSVSAGFTSPADDYLESTLDLNELLIKKPTATFFIRVKGDCMIGAGIYNQDLIVIDRSLTAKNNDVVLAMVSGEFTLKHFIQNSYGTFLYPNNPKYKPLKITEEMDFQIWGVATSCIHNLR